MTLPTHSLSAIPNPQKGVALLLALLLVALLSAVGVLVVSDVGRVERIEANSARVQQGRWLAEGAFALAQARRDKLRRASEDSAGSSFVDGPVRFDFELESGMLSVTIRDGQSCFNLNSLSEGAGDIWQERPSAARQFLALLLALELPRADAEALVSTTTDWLVGGGGFANRFNADAEYTSLPVPYGVAGQPFAETSEWRAVLGVTPDVYSRVRPFLCARPTSGSSPININALPREAEELLVALSEGVITRALARRLLDARPSSGFASAADLWADPLLAGLTPPVDSLAETVTRSDHFELEVTVRHLGTELAYSGWAMDSAEGLVLTALRWTEVE